MSKNGILILLMVSIGGCSSAEFNKIANDTMSAGLGSVMSTVGTPVSPGSRGAASVSKGDTRSDAVEGSNINTSKAAKTARDLGKISLVKTEKNPKDQTKIILDGCSHPRIGGLRCGGYIFEVTAEGWLIDKPITFDDLNRPEIVIASGTYYLKFTNWDSGRNRFASGSFEVKPFMTNHLFVELE